MSFSKGPGGSENTTERPRPLSEFGYFAYEHVSYLRRFAAVGELMRAGHRSLHAVSREILRLKKARRLPPGTAHSVSAISVLPVHLEELFRRAFGRRIELYQGAGEGFAFLGLTADGETALEMTQEYLAEIDRQTGGGQHR
jgi:hypothetical protein